MARSVPTALLIVMTPTRAFVFPGQGSQSIGMGKDLADASPAAREVFEAVDDALGQDLSGLMFEGDADTLTLTENAQPALMAVSMAVLTVVRDRLGPDLDSLCRFVAGHSLGEYSALTAAGALSLADAARLLKRRGRAMQRAVPVGDGAMAALLGLDPDAAAAVADAAAADTGAICAVANDNADGQVVVSGHKQAVDRAVALAAERGAKRSVLLPVSAPFHCSLMQPAADEMADALADVTIRSPAVPLVSNVLAAPVSEPDRIRDLLVSQVTGKVRWRESMQWLAGQGVTELVEVGAGRVLSGLARRIDRSLTAVPLNAVADIDRFVARLDG